MRQLEPMSYVNLRRHVCNGSWTPAGLTTLLVGFRPQDLLAGGMQIALTIQVSIHHDIADQMFALGLAAGVAPMFLLGVAIGGVGGLCDQLVPELRTRALIRVAMVQPLCAPWLLSFDSGYKANMTPAELATHIVNNRPLLSRWQEMY